MFFENSTRTRISFELAQKRLSADTVNFSASTSSLKKGESFKDTAQNIEAMKIDAVVMRHPSPGAPYQLKKFKKFFISPTFFLGNTQTSKEKIKLANDRLITSSSK